MPPKRKTPQPKQKPKKKGPTSQRRPNAQSFPWEKRVDHCLRDWMLAYASPFTYAKAVCLPMPPSPPSYKLRTRIFGTLMIGTASSGFIMGAINAASDNPAAYYSATNGGGAYGGSTFSGNTGLAGINSTTNSTSPYTTAQFSSTGLRSRCVLAGCRVRYIGTELNRGGRILPIVFPNHRNIDGVQSSMILALQGYTSEKFDNKWHSIRWIPQYTHETDYEPTAIVVDDADAPNNTQIGIYIESPTVGSQFEWELVYYHEIVGTTFSLTESHASPLAATAAAAVSDMGATTARSGGVIDALRRNAPSVIDAVGAAGRAAYRLVNIGGEYDFQPESRRDFRPIADGAM